jgi:hypothetical protein
MNYYLTNEEATLIRNLLHKERIEFSLYDGGGALSTIISNAIDAMEHPKKYQPIEGQ